MRDRDLRSPPVWGHEMGRRRIGVATHNDSVAGSLQRAGHLASRRRKPCDERDLELDEPRLILAANLREHVFACVGGPQSQCTETEKLNRTFMGTKRNPPNRRLLVISYYFP